jgi:hypothetical protein
MKISALSNRCNLAYFYLVPPRSLVIKNDKNQVVSGLIGPFNEGSDVRLVCSADGGKPSPYVHWYKDDQLIDDTYAITTTNGSANSMVSVMGSATVHNEIIISKVGRHWFNSVLSCVATNNLTKATVIRVSLDINREIFSVKSYQRLI